MIEPYILFVDDDPDIRELVQALLQVAGFRVSTTDNASEALQLAATGRFDALLLDYCMPRLSGLELCRQIRSFDQNTPILICSGAVTPADKQAAAQAGAQGYVGKPFKSKDLIRVLRSVIEMSRVDDHLARLCPKVLCYSTAVANDSSLSNLLVVKARQIK